jgi:hypothetical protein
MGDIADPAIVLIASCETDTAEFNEVFAGARGRAHISVRTVSAFPVGI